MRHIAKQEKVNISDEALELIAVHGEGSFRDSISLLDQIRNNDKKVELEDVQNMLGIAPSELIEDILTGIQKYDSLAVSESLNQIHDQGYEPARVAKQVGTALRKKALEGHISLSHDSLINLMYQLIQVPTSPEPRVTLEIALLDITLSKSSSPSIAAAPSKQAASGAKTMSVEIQAHPSIQTQPKRTVTATDNNESQATTDITQLDDKAILSKESWDLVLQSFKQKYSTLYSIAKIARTEFEPGKLILKFEHPFHQKRFNEAHNKTVLSKAITEVTGSQIQIVCIVEKEATDKSERLSPDDIKIDDKSADQAVPPLTVAKSSPVVDSISNIFGGAELLES